MAPTVALWAPEIEPPIDWLVPAILYQDKIATFAPELHLDDGDGEASHRMRELLGDLYEPVSLMGAFAQKDRRAADLIQSVFEARLQSWLTTARRIDPAGVTYTGRWAERASSFERRMDYLQSQSHILGAEAREAKSQKTAISELLNQKREFLRQEEIRLSAMRDEARHWIENKKTVRREAMAPLVGQLHSLSRQKDALDPLSDERRYIDEAISAVKKQIDETQQEVAHPGLFEIQIRNQQLADIRKDVKQLKCRLNELCIAHDRILRRLEANAIGIREPWTGNTVFDPVNLRSLPPELDTIALGKIYGQLFDFLASRGGLWVVSPPDMPYAGTLVGPRFVIAEVMMIIAMHVAEQRQDYVLMMADQRSQALSSPTSALATAAAVTWMLPVPHTSDLEAVCNFRKRHSCELDALKEFIRTPISNSKSVEELRDVVHDLQVECQSAAKEIERALKLDGRTGLAYVRSSAISAVGAHFRDVVVASSLGTVPMLQTAMGGGNALDSAPAGAFVSGVTLMAITAINSLRAWSARRRILSPFLYTYESLRGIQ